MQLVQVLHTVERSLYLRISTVFLSSFYDLQPIIKSDCLGLSLVFNLTPVWHLARYLIPLCFSSVAQSCLTLCDPMDHSCGPQASLSITNSLSLCRLMSIESVMPSNHLILCHPLILLPSIIPSIRVFSNELVLRFRWPKCWIFSFIISPSNEYSRQISF